MDGSRSMNWAIPIEPNALGAALESYAHHRDAITTLWKCAQASGSQQQQQKHQQDQHQQEREQKQEHQQQQKQPPIARLPPEILDMIVAHVMLDGHDARFKAWTRCLDCLQNSCRAADHVYLSDRYVERMCSIMRRWVRDKFQDLGVVPPWSRVAVDKVQNINLSLSAPRELKEEVISVHKENCLKGQERYLSKESEGSLHDYSKILATDFGLEVITTQYVWGTHDPFKLHIPQGPTLQLTPVTWRRAAKAMTISDTISFLCLPSRAIDGANLDTSSLNPLPSEHRRFGRAMRVLGLRPYASLRPPLLQYPEQTVRHWEAPSALVLEDQRDAEAVLERLWMKRERELEYVDVGMGVKVRAGDVSVFDCRDGEGLEKNGTLERLTLEKSLEDDVEKEVWPKLVMVRDELAVQLSDGP